MGRKRSAPEELSPGVEEEDPRGVDAHLHRVAGLPREFLGGDGEEGVPPKPL
jgi:hypothetical protein